MPEPRTTVQAAAGLPIAEVLDELGAHLAARSAVVLVAPPGAGKTTIVPLALLDAPWLDGRRILMLEPRRVAARSAARRMASLLGEEVGGRVGYRTRTDTRVGRDTRIEVVTEGIVTRMLQHDPALDGVGIVIFDEFHERSIHADLGLALALDAQAALRPDLRILVMSATLATQPLARLLGDAPIVRSDGRVFPVATRHADRRPAGPIEPAVASAVLRAIETEPGSVLVFLPGEREIRRVAAILAEAVRPETRIEPLYGNLDPAAQDRAIAPAPAGTRKIVLATSIAETSLTIEGVRIVVDSGLRRALRFDPSTGLERLETVRISAAASEQRRGRAGRIEPGVCVRLWPEAEQSALLPFEPPEIATADLAPLALEIAAWGADGPAALRWLDPPPAGPYASARELLVRLGALDANARLTDRGREMARLGMHPRLAAMVIRCRDEGLGTLATLIASLLEERDILRAGPTRDSDIRHRLEILARDDERAEPGVDRALARQVRIAAREHARRLDRGGAGRTRLSPEAIASAGRALAYAYPDRIALRRAGSTGQFLLSNGRGAALPPADPLAAADALVAADIDGAGAEARIHLAAPIAIETITDIFADDIAAETIVAWDNRSRAVVARRRRRLGALVLHDEPITGLDPARRAEAMREGVRALGLAALPWTREATQMRARIAFAAAHGAAPGGWPAVSDDALLTDLDGWLTGALGGFSRADDLARLDLARLLRDRLDHAQRASLDRFAPTHLVVASGARLPVDYEAGAIPVLAVRLQQMFGTARHPVVGDGRVPVVLQLLSPAGRPVQITRDIAGFWRDSYRAVRREMFGRYPKHPWPEDPLAAPPTDRAKPRK